MRTPVGLKISGANLATIEQIGTQIESLLPRVKGTRGVFAERTGNGYFLDFEWNCEKLAHYGLSIEEAQLAVENAIGGEDVTTAVRGRERYPVNVRYMSDFRSDLGALQRVLVPAGGQRQVPLGELAETHTSSGPAMIRADRLRLRRCCRPRCAKLRYRSQDVAARPAETCSRICHLLERTT